MNGAARSAQEKALAINLDPQRFGTFAEIGAGQEVVRWFFHVGKASGTVAKSISAYGKEISDALYGTATHYVSRERLEAMMQAEFQQLTERLDAAHRNKSALFVFADTMATHGSSRASEGHGWLGVHFQDRPGSEPSEVIIHVEMLDKFTTSRQEAVGLVGVNLLYGAFTSHEDPAALVRGLMDGLDRRRIEIDMIKFSGPVFHGVDHRLMSLQLVENGFTDAAMFTAAGDVIQPSEILHGRRVLIERGSFRPVTNVTLGMLEAAKRQLEKLGDHAAEPVVLMEMTLNNLMAEEKIDHQDFVARAEVLGALNKTVMISNYTRFDCVTTYLRQYTEDRVGMVVGIPTLRAIFDEQYYGELQGGILEGLGRLFQGVVRLFVYPTMSPDGELETSDHVTFDSKLQKLYDYLLENDRIESIREFDAAQLHTSPADVLQMIQSGDPAWTRYVPAEAAELIEQQRLFGYAPAHA
jgi:hypothetical protein